MVEGVEIHELEDDPDRCYVFGFPEDANAAHVEGLAKALDNRLEEAEVLLFSGDVESDMVIAEVDPDEVERIAAGEAGEQ